MGRNSNEYLSDQYSYDTETQELPGFPSEEYKNERYFASTSTEQTQTPLRRTSKSKQVLEAKAMSQESHTGKKASKQRSKTTKRVLNLLFYIFIVLIVLVTYLSSSQNKGYRSIGGYSVFSVLTGSMESQIPQGSLVLVKKVEDSKIKVGDVITFVIKAGDTKTHQVVGILDNYNNSGQRGYRTKGSENELADKEIVYAGNVIGVVEKHVPKLGTMFSYVRENMWLLVVVLISFFIASFSLKRFFSLKKGEKESNSFN